MPVLCRLDQAMMSRVIGESSIKMYNSSRELRGGSHSLISSRSWKFMSPILTVFIIIIAISSFQCVRSEEIPPPPVVALPENVTVPPGARDGNNNGNAQQESPISTLSKCGNKRNSEGKITISCTSYATIPDDLSELYSSDVNVLEMNGGTNSLQILERDAFSRSKWTILNKVDLRNCSIRGIKKGAFRGGKAITEINLSNNLIDVLDPEVFADLPRLQTLYLQNNHINRFVSAEAMFPHSDHLTTLDLSNCKLDTVPIKVFDNLIHLNKLSLHNNQLKYLDWRVFHSTRVKTLTLYNNPWHCDCELKFLKDTLHVRSLGVVSQQATCASTGSGASEWRGKSWKDVPVEQMICNPKISKFEYTIHDALHSSTAVAVAETHTDSNQNGMVKVGQEVYFECEYSGYPRPEIKWLKNKQAIKLPDDSMRTRRQVRSLSETNQNGNNTSDNLEKSISNAVDDSSPLSTSTPPPLVQPKIQFQDVTYKIVGEMGEDERKHNYKFVQLFILRHIQEEDKATYTCLVRHAFDGGAFDEKEKFLNVSIPADDIFYGGLGGKKRVAIWMWILIGLLCSLILVLITLVAILVWRRREKRKQDGFRKVVQDKFKDSNIDLGEFNIKPMSPHSQQSKGTSRIDGATPLLDNGSETSTILISDHHLQQKAPPLPDVALGNVELLRNSQIFSPKPPPAHHHGYPVDARKEFFARQISEPYLRPASSLSISRPAAINAAQRRYIFANHPAYQSDPVPIDLENLYAVPTQIRTLPRSGSAMSMSAIPEHDLRRQMFMRQYSNPQSHPYSHYGTTSRVPARRIPSTSSEPPQENIMAAYNYSTLPRRPVRLQNWSRPVSPSNSTCSTYSTLSWRPNFDSNGVASDGVGVRKGACGGSQTSINRLPDMNGSVIGISGGGDDGVFESVNRAPMLTPSNVGKMKNVPISRNPRYGHNRTPSSLTRGHNDFFSFEPIQEVESSECASTQHLDRAGKGRQTPTGYTTQSLARGEPRYKKKKPPSITMIPANLKTPSRAFDHLKGRSVSPAFRNGNQPKEETIVNNLNSSVPAPVQNNIVNSTTSNGTNNSLLESPIDEVPPAFNTSVSKPAPPPPPPKPKRNPNLDEENNGVVGDPATTQELQSQKNEVTADGTVV